MMERYNQEDLNQQEIMTTTITFSKLSGSGNDFLCIDNRDGQYDAMLADPAWIGHFSQTLCRRALGVGADGIVFALRPDPEVDGFADVAARFLEADGTETYLCGNGTACFVRWAVEKDIVGQGEAKILTSAGVVRGRVLDDGYVRVCIPLPEDKRTDLELDVGGQKLMCDYIVTGIEHVVVYVDDIADADVAHLGPLLRNHEAFPQPRGVNANFVQVLGEGEIAIRTYEYGVEAETLACGTGSAAAAILSAERFGWGDGYSTGDKPIRIHAPSGDVLRVLFETDDEGRINDLCLDTVVRCTYAGSVCPDLTRLSLARPKAADDEADNADDANDASDADDPRSVANPCSA